MRTYPHREPYAGVLELGTTITDPESHYRDTVCWTPYASRHVCRCPNPKWYTDEEAKQLPKEVQSRLTIRYNYKYGDSYRLVPVRINEKRPWQMVKDISDPNIEKWMGEAGEPHLSKLRFVVEFPEEAKQVFNTNDLEWLKEKLSYPLKSKNSV